MLKKKKKKKKKNDLISRLNDILCCFIFHSVFLGLVFCPVFRRKETKNNKIKNGNKNKNNTFRFRYLAEKKLKQQQKKILSNVRQKKI